MTQKLPVKTMKDPGSVIVWGGFSQNLGRAGLYSLLKTYQRKKYLHLHFKRASLNILEDTSMRSFYT